MQSALRLALAALFVTACAAAPARPTEPASARPVASPSDPASPTGTAAQPAAPSPTTSPAPTAAQPPTPTPAPTATAPAPAETALLEALMYAPADVTDVYFTDWAQIRHQLGADELTGAAPAEEKLDVLSAGLLGNSAQGVPPTEGTFAGFAVDQVATHHADWGFDVFDLDWEAVVYRANSSPLWVLRLREQFDPAAFEGRLTAYGFSSEEFARGTLRAIEPQELLGLVTDHPTDFSIGAIARLDDRRTLVLGGSTRLDFGNGPLLRQVLTDGPAQGAGAAADAVARLLDEPFAAALSIGQRCTRYGRPFGGNPDLLRRIGEIFDVTGPLDVYEVLGIGYSRARDPIGRIVFEYATAGQAAADLDGRRLLATDGFSLTAPARPFAQTHFALESAALEGNAIVLDVAPAGDAPERLTRMIFQRDMLFAACTD